MDTVSASSSLSGKLTTAPLSFNATNRSNSCASDIAPSLPKVCAALHRKITDFLDTPPRCPLVAQVQAQTRISLDAINTALGSYSLDELAISFNGGKDCLVLLVLLLAALSPHRMSPTAKIPAVYVMCTNPFGEVDDFVDTCIDDYALDLYRYLLPMKSAFASYLSKNSSVKAIFVGTRRTDPHGRFLTHFDPTDKGWPQFMRIHPVINWRYQEIWSFLKEVEVPYCKLYDLGYTSLGGTTDTHPNPILKVEGGYDADAENPRFRPAYELVEDEQERLGRDK